MDDNAMVMTIMMMAKVMKMMTIMMVMIQMWVGVGRTDCLVLVAY